MREVGSKRTELRPPRSPRAELREGDVARTIWARRGRGTQRRRAARARLRVYPSRRRTPVRVNADTSRGADRMCPTARERLGRVAPSSAVKAVTGAARRVVVHAARRGEGEVGLSACGLHNTAALPMGSDVITGLGLDVCGYRQRAIWSLMPPTGSGRTQTRSGLSAL
jgi:hypothetical protein